MVLRTNSLPDGLGGGLGLEWLGEDDHARVLQHVAGAHAHDLLAAADLSLIDELLDPSKRGLFPDARIKYLTERTVPRRSLSFWKSMERCVHFPSTVLDMVSTT